jgi:6-pyruvoyl-tetrahydropterin synthase
MSVRALHQLPVDGPEGELHPHEYRIDVMVSRDDLDPTGMVVDLDGLDAALGALHDEVDGRDLEMIRPDHAVAVTVEVFAHWAHGRLAPAVRHSGGGELTVRVYESAMSFGGYRATVS